MHCDTSSRPFRNLTEHKHPRAVHAEVLRFVRGIRGPRQNPVSHVQILQWLRWTPQKAVDAALADLVTEGRVRACILSFRTPSNSHRRAMGYEIAGGEA